MLKVKTHILSPRELRNAHSDTHWSGKTMCGIECGGQIDVAMAESRRLATCRACLRGERKFDRSSHIGAPDRLRDQDSPEVLGYALSRESLTPTRKRIDVTRSGDYGADPIGDGTFRMVPSGDVVDFEERNRRLKR